MKDGRGMGMYSSQSIYSLSIMAWVIRHTPLSVAIRNAFAIKFTDHYRQPDLSDLDPAINSHYIWSLAVNLTNINAAAEQWRRLSVEVAVHIEIIGEQAEIDPHREARDDSTRRDERIDRMTRRARASS